MDKLNILWTTTNKETVTNMISMYSTNALTQSWWKQVNVIVWGGSAKLIAEDVEIQNEIQKMLKVGVSIEACLACSDGYGVTDTLVQLGLDVKYMGEPLTDYIKKGEKILTL
ncbi:DsrE family protein [Labilibaculum sp. DW002]|uniref:DsrE family protein n=1 Tax=Paralabilibaculum antarcticum TaxID=2912572 RepID=A0ABT5VYP4_9BACT|nr:DsrE family protein [Labilibaculum sp. DW002]MDE5419653.1 DsrE family protein [Labilibaculum sp. DW002]